MTYVIVGTALASGEDGVIDAFLEVGGVFEVLAEENETGTGTTKSLVAENTRQINFRESTQYKRTWWW